MQNVKTLTRFGRTKEMNMRLIKRRPITFRDALAAAKEIGTETLRTLPRDEAAALVAAQALKTKGVDPADPAIDWEGLIEFVERLLPIILAIIEMFG
jgi:orotate phosphoribosyltransferase-like protein